MEQVAPKPRLPLRTVRTLFILGGILSASAVGAGEPPAPAEGVLVTLKGHSEIVYAVAFSPDGKYVLTGSFDKTVRLWDAATGKEIKNFDGPAGHQNLVLSVAFSPDGRMLASGGSDNTAKLWDTPLSTPVRELVHADAVNTFALSPDGTKMAAAGRDGTVMVWNAGNGHHLFNLTGHTGPVMGVAFSANGELLATGGSDKTVRFWNGVNGQAMEILGTHAAAVNAVRFNPSNNALNSAAQDGTLRSWQFSFPARQDGSPGAQSLSITRTISAAPAPVRDLALTPNGSHIVTASGDKSVKLWNVGNGGMERFFIGAEGEVDAVAVSKNGVLLAAGGADKSVRLYTLADAKQQAILKTTGPIRSLAFSPDNLMLAAACEDKSVVTWNVAYNAGQPLAAEFGKPGPAYPHAAAVTQVAFAADGTTLYSSSVDKTIKAWKLAKAAPIKSLAHANLVDAVAFNPSGTQVATGSHDGTVRMWDVANGQQVRQIAAHTIPMMTQVYCVAWSPDGKYLASGSLDHSLKLWDSATGTLVREFHADTGKQAASAAPVLSGRTLCLLGSPQGAGPLLAASLLVPRGTEPAHQEGVFCAAFSPDGKLLASGSSDRTIKIWNVVDGVLERELVNHNLKSAAKVAGQTSPPPPQSHPGWVYGLRFTPAGTHLVSVGNAPRNQGYLAVWAAADGRLLYGEALPLGAFYSVAISPNGKLLAVGCGPRGRQLQEVDAYIVKMPNLDRVGRISNPSTPSRPPAGTDWKSVLRVAVW
jgi:WD40 repeat protein